MRPQGFVFYIYAAMTAHSECRLPQFEDQGFFATSLASQSSLKSFGHRLRTPPTVFPSLCHKTVALPLPGPSRTGLR